MVKISEGEKLYFAQFGNGQGFTSEVVLLNPSTTDTVLGTAEFLDDNGLPLPVSIAAIGNDRILLSTSALPLAVTSSVDFSIPPLDVVTISTDGQGDLAVGSAVVNSTHPLGGVIRFSIPNIGIAGIGLSQPLSSFITPVRLKAGGINTGIAIHNTESQAVTLNLMLRDVQQGQEIATATIESFPASGHLAQFINELFPDANTDDFQGTLVVQVEGGKVAATALELGTQAGQFSSLPVTPFRVVVADDLFIDREKG